MEMLQGVWKQHLRPRAVVGYGVKIFLPTPQNYVTRSPGKISGDKKRGCTSSMLIFNIFIHSCTLPEQLSLLAS